MRRDDQIVWPDGASRRLQPDPDLRIVSIDGRFERKDRQNGQHGFDLLRETRGLLPRGAEPQLGSNQQTDADSLFANLGDAVPDDPLGIADQVRYDPGIEEEWS